jgi:putative salt-induced outer membrane protein
MRIVLLSLSLVLPCVSLADWKNTTEGGVVIANGNSRSQSFTVKDENNYNWDDERNTFNFKGSFLQTKALGVLNAKRWDAALRYERALDERLSLFVGQGVESDRFAGFMQRYNTDVGPKYIFIKKENFDWTGEVGYRYSRERRLDGSEISKNQVRLYTELNRKWNDATSSKYWIEYLPNFSDSRDWLLNSELSTSAAITTILAIKAAFLVKYDNTPAPTAGTKTDSLFTTSLVAKY